MPRNTFSVGMLRGATPGLSRLAQQIGGGDTSYQQGYDNELGLQSKLALQLAQRQGAEAQARHHDAQASELGSKQRVLDSRPDLYNEQAAIGAGVSVPDVVNFREFLKTGQMPTNQAQTPTGPAQPLGPPAEDGGMGVTTLQPKMANPALQSKVGQQLMSLLPILSNTGDLNPEQMAKARGLDRKSALSEAIIAGTANRNVVGGAEAAVDGKPLYHAAEFGSTDNFTGGVDASGPVAQRFGKFRDSATAENVAQAGSAKASAANSYAHANKANFETQQLKDAPKGKFDPASGMIIDERGATARPVMVDGQPMGGRANDKPLPPAVVKQITEVRDNAATIGRLEKSFKPEYGGKGVLGFGADMQLSASGNMGVDKDSVEWWKNYRKQAELIERHALFGAALTPNEQASWQSADIAPGMHPKVIERNLATRAALSKKVFENARQDAIDAGHNERRVGAIADRNMEVPGAAGKNVAVDY